MGVVLLTVVSKSAMGITIDKSNNQIDEVTLSKARGCSKTSRLYLVCIYEQTKKNLLSSKTTEFQLNLCWLQIDQGVSPHSCALKDPTVKEAVACGMSRQDLLLVGFGVGGDAYLSDRRYSRK